MYPDTLDTVRRHSRRVLADESGSFDWAALLLSPSRRDDAAVVYAFCRLVDDIADEADDRRRAADRLSAIRDELTGSVDPRPLVAVFRRVCRRHGIALESPRELIRGVTSDLGPVAIETDRELLRYCYRVAGTVGLMMAPLIGVDRRRALPHAIDLGIGMQLTNICRDVAEDAEIGRIYVPTRRLEAAGIAPEALLDGDPDRAALSRVVADLLDLADDYYRSGRAGMRYISARPRAAIAVASRLYRAIGDRLRRRDCDPLAGPISFGAADKLARMGAALVDAFNPLADRRTDPPDHRAELHTPIGDLPGAHSPALRSNAT